MAGNSQVPKDVLLANLWQLARRNLYRRESGLGTAESHPGDREEVLTLTKMSLLV